VVRATLLKGEINGSFPLSCFSNHVFVYVHVHTYVRTHVRTFMHEGHWNIQKWCGEACIRLLAAISRIDLRLISIYREIEWNVPLIE
jgi:hypothetical protein